MITNQRPPRGGATYENVPPRGGARPPRGGILLSTINNQFPTSWTARPHEEDASALASWAGEADGGMQRDAGVIGRRMTAAENAIDSAVLELAYDRHRVGRNAGTAAGAAVCVRTVATSCWSSTVVAACRCRLGRGSCVDTARGSRGSGATAREQQHGPLARRCLLVFVCSGSSALCALHITDCACCCRTQARTIVPSGPRACELLRGAHRVVRARPTSWRPMGM